MRTPRLGPLVMMGAALAFTVMLACVKVAREELGSLEIITWRGLVAVPIALGLALKVGLRPHNTSILILRSVMGFVAMALYFTAAREMPLADLTLISRIQPMLVAALAPLFLGADERVSWKIWLLLGLGLGGCAILLAPDLAAGSTSGLLALVGTGFAAGAHLCLRSLGRTDDPRVVVFWFQVVMLFLAMLGSTLLSGRPLSMPSFTVLPYVIGAGLASVVGQLLLTMAYRLDRAGVVAGAEYTALLWALLADLVFFAAVPGLHAALGGLLVLGAGITLLFVETRPRTLAGLA